MSSLKFGPNLFLDNLELQRYDKFVFQDGWERLVKTNTKSWGLISNPSDTNFDYFKINQSTPISGNVTFQMTFGIGMSFFSSEDKVKFFVNNNLNPIPFPQDGNWYWIKVAPKQEAYETGVVSVDSDGNLTGVGTKFTEVLRGQPDFASRIKLYKLQSDNLTYLASSLNPIEYEVVSVVDDENCIIQGDVQTETDLYYTVVGTFTPGAVIPTQNKEIFQYDSCEISIVQENLLATSPTKPSYSANEEFFIYRIKYDSGNLIIQDFRTELYQSKEMYEIEFVTAEPNPLVGLESIEYDDENSPRDKNLFKLAWGMRSTAYNISTNLNKLTVTAGSGGKYKSSNDFSTGDFNGWRLYVLDRVRNNATDDTYSNQEKYFKIVNSTKNGTNIELSLDRLTINDFIPANYESGSVYSNDDKVSTGGTFYKLITQSATGVSPTQSVWSNATTYAINQYVAYSNGVYKSLQNGNLNNQPDTSSAYWEKIWETFIPQILIVPDAEQIVFEINVGTGVSSLVANPETVNVKVSSLIREPWIKIPVIAINDAGVIDYSIYTIKYWYKTNKAYGIPRAIPSDSIGYYNEDSVLTPYGSDFFYAQFKAYKHPNCYSKVIERIDTGDLFGVELITDIEATAVLYSGRSIPFEVGVRKQSVEITGDFSVPLTGDITLNLSTTGAKNNSRFYIYLKSSLNNNQIGFNNGEVIYIKQDDSSVLYTLNQDEINKGEQFFICTYDSVLGWKVVHFDKDYNGDCVFKEGEEILTDVQNIGGKNVLVASGYYETIILQPTGNLTVDGVQFLNGKYVNNLKILNGSSFFITFNDYTTVPSPSAGVKRFFEPIYLTPDKNTSFFIKDSSNGIYSQLLPESIEYGVVTVTNSSFRFDNWSLLTFTLVTSPPAQNPTINWWRIGKILTINYTLNVDFTVVGSGSETGDVYIKIPQISSIGNPDHLDENFSVPVADDTPSTSPDFAIIDNIVDTQSSQGCGLDEVHFRAQVSGPGTKNLILRGQVQVVLDI